MPGSPATVLTAENDPIVRAELRLVLEDAGFTVCAEARDGAEAVTLAERHRPDLILLDLSMPVKDGVDAAADIRAARHVPFVALTGHVSGPLVERAKREGAAAVVIKPFREEAVVDAVCVALAQGVDPDAVDPRSARAVAGARQASQATLRELAALLGQPAEVADELERRAFAAGRVWRRVR